MSYITTKYNYGDNLDSFDIPLEKFVVDVTEQIYYNEIMSLSPEELAALGNTKTLSYKFTKKLDGIKIIDPEVSWDIFFIHAMRRKSGGYEPAPFFRVMVKQFIQIRRQRTNLIERIRKDVFIQQYELFVDSKLIAAKYKDRSFEVLDSKLYDECLRIPTESETYRHLFFLYRTKQNNGNPDSSFLWQASPESKSDSTTMDAPAATVPYKKSLYKEEIGLFDEETQKEFWSAELLLLKGLIDKQNISSYDSTIPWEQNHCATVLNSEDRTGVTPILEYLQGKLPLDKLDLTKNNALKILRIVKILDLAGKMNNRRRKGEKVWFPKSSYELRTRILQLESPRMKSYEAYTMTLHEGKMTREDYWLDQDNWLTERIGLYHKIMAQQFIQSRALSDELKLIRVISGGTAVGKSTMAPKGTLNPDEFKFFLKRESEGVNNTQIHEEGSTVFKRFLKKVFAGHGSQTDTQLTRLNFALDKRMKKVKDLEEIVQAAKIRGVPVEFRDLDAPLPTSLIRVLTRDPYGRNPCPTLEAIKEGFIQIRKSRLAIIKKIESEDIIHKYQLFCFAPAEGTERYMHKEVAKKENGSFTILDRDLYEKMTNEPSSDEIEEELRTVITPELIQASIIRGDIREEDKVKIQRWVGKPIGEAVSLHALGKFT